MFSGVSICSKTFRFVQNTPKGYKEIQKYNYYGKDGKAPNENLGCTVLYRPEWHEAGSIKIENPQVLLSKLITITEHNAIFDYYKGEVYKNQDGIWWYNMLVEGKGNNIAGGAVLAKKPADFAYFLMVHNEAQGALNGLNVFTGYKEGYPPIVRTITRIPAQQ